MALGGQHRPLPRIAGRGLGAARGPGLQILERIDDAAAGLPVGRTGALGAVFLQGAAGEAQKRAASGVRR